MSGIKIKMRDNGKGSKAIAIPATWLKAHGNPNEIVLTLGDKIIIEAP
jgi:hypothetical protein